MTFWKTKKTKKIFVKQKLMQPKKLSVAFFYKSGKLIQDCKNINLQ